LTLWLRCSYVAPAALAVAAFAIAFPFYGTINAVIGAITSPLVAFAFPAAAYSWLHRTKARQAASLRPPPK
jgi:auxin influx carrier (AUX1 LAX family)